MKKKPKEELSVRKTGSPSWPYLLLALALLVLDQLTKALVRTLPLGSRMPLLPGFLWLSHVENTGASFSILQGSNALLAWVAVIVLGILIYAYGSFRTRVERVIYALLLAGLLGNLVDRLLFGAVTDFVDLGWFPVFNVADSCLVVGVSALVAYELFRKGHAKNVHS